VKDFTPTDEQMQEAIARQDGMAVKLEELQARREITLARVCMMIEQLKPLVEELNGGSLDESMTKDEVRADAIEKWFDPNFREKLKKELFSNTFFVESNKSYAEWERLSIEYAAEFAKYIEMINEDRDKLFSPRYKDCLDRLADDGWFLYFMQTPDFPIELIDNPKVVEILTENFIATAPHQYDNILNMSSHDNHLTEAKLTDFEEALKCFYLGAFRSCARTLFAILEHEHRSFSNLQGITRGAERAKAINDNLSSVKIDYYTECWEKIDKRYKAMNASAKTRDKSIINRHELMHGQYDMIVTATDCVKLFHMYTSMKEMSHFLQNIYEVADIANDYMKLFLEVYKRGGKK